MRHVIGLGNILHGDDGAGPAICRMLSDHRLAEDVRVFDAGTRGLDALALLTNCREAFLIDAAVPGKQPGLIRELDRDELQVNLNRDIHTDGLTSLLLNLPLINEHIPVLRIITIEAKDVRRFDQHLSPEVLTSCRLIADRLTQELGIQHG